MADHGRMVVSATPGRQTTSTDSSVHVTSIANLIWIYFGFVVFIVGIAGNLAILAVTTRRRMKGTSTATYLTIMAIADLVLLVVGIIPDWLQAMKIVSWDQLHPLTCKIDKFSKYAFSDTAIWIIVLFTIDRCVAICNPLHKTSCCLPRSVKYYSLGAFVLAIVKNVHVFWTRGAKYVNTPVQEAISNNSSFSNRTVSTLVSVCGYPRQEYEDFEYYVRPWFALAFVNIAPCAVICLCNLLIVREMIRMKKTPVRISSATYKRNSQVLQTSAMCLAGSISFLICITPSIVLTVGKPYWTARPNLDYDIAKAVNNVIYYVNYSINFFLYCLTGKKFRTTLVQMCSRKKHSLELRLTNSSDLPKTTTIRLKAYHGGQDSKVTFGAGALNPVQVDAPEHQPLHEYDEVVELESQSETDSPQRSQRRLIIEDCSEENKNGD